MKQEAYDKILAACRASAVPIVQRWFNINCFENNADPVPYRLECNGRGICAIAAVLLGSKPIYTDICADAAKTLGVTVGEVANFISGFDRPNELFLNATTEDFVSIRMGQCMYRQLVAEGILKP